MSVYLSIRNLTIFSHNRKLVIISKLLPVLSNSSAVLTYNHCTYWPWLHELIHIQNHSTASCKTLRYVPVCVCVCVLIYSILQFYIPISHYIYSVMILCHFDTVLYLHCYQSLLFSWFIVIISLFLFMVSVACPSSSFPD